MIPALYIHIPFCRKICPFCSFAVRPDHPGKHAPYFSGVQREFQLLLKELKPDLSRIRTIYFGGGTPSRLTLEELQEWVVWLSSEINLDSQVQWSIEVNPEDLTLTYAKGLIELGFGRISVGVQSFRDAALSKLHRCHTSEDARRAVENLHAVGFVDFNLDLMFGYPGQELEHLEADLAELIGYNPAHISAYCLSIEERTPLFKKPEWQVWQVENEDGIRSMYALIVDQLTSRGYRQYEISNFALKGMQSRQNLVNWNGRNYLGLGMGAHSLLNHQRWGNYRRWVDYKNTLQEGRLPRQFMDILCLQQRRDEQLMLSLRQNKGLNLAGFASIYGLDVNKRWHTRLAQLEEAGLVKTQSGRLQLTIGGMLLADTITADLAALLDT